MEFINRREKMSTPLTYKLIFEDDSIFIVDKPQGMATASGQLKHLCGQVFADFPYLSEVKGYRKGEGGLLNRLDNETGGLVLFAKTDQAFSYYNAQMKSEKIVKYYTAVVQGNPRQASGILDFPIAHHEKNKKRMVVVNAAAHYRSQPRRAVTEWRLVKGGLPCSVLRVVIRKGVRHQIRVHLAYTGMPIVGDKLYNKNRSKHTYHLLYATGVKFVSMAGGKVVLNIKAPFLANLL
jgi:23S rRNA pseudouridine1911/1915/1917 synthase